MREFQKEYQAYRIASPTVEEIRKVVPSYEAVLLSVLQYMIRSYRKDPDYPFINTKIDVFTGEALHRDVNGTDLFGMETIYGWIQGRGLEAVGRHYLWLKKTEFISPEERDYFQAQCLRILREVSSTLNAFRKRNNGRLSFWMDREGNAFRLDKNHQKEIFIPASDEAGFSDLFSVKGLIISAYILKDEGLEAEIKAWYGEIMDCLRQGRFRTDQEDFDPKNKVAFIPGKISHAPCMIAIGMCLLFYELYNDLCYVDDGLYLINQVFGRYVNDGLKFKTFEKPDMPEYITPGGEPYFENGHVATFPGHIMELAGVNGQFFSFGEKGKKCLRGRGI